MREVRIWGGGALLTSRGLVNVPKEPTVDVHGRCPLERGNEEALAAGVAAAPYRREAIPPRGLGPPTYVVPS